MRVERRPEPSRLMVYLAPVLALGATLLAGAVLFGLLGVPVLDAFHALFLEPLQSEFDRAELGVKAAPLILMGAALSMGFRANVWNIGAEGQFVVGAICGGAVALWFYEVEAWYVLPLMALAGILGGMFWAAIPALLRTRFNASEILTSLMLTYVAILLLSYLVHGILRDPEGYSFPESRLFHQAATLPIVLENTRLHIGFPIAIALSIAFWVLLSRTLIGFQLKVVGSAPRAGQHTGFQQSSVIWFCLLLGGAAAGLSGLFEVSGPIGQLLPNISPGYGFTAIIVAFLGRLHPLGVIPAGLIMALSYIGGESAQISLNLPTAVTGVFQGLLLFFLLGMDVLIFYRVRFGRGPTVVDGRVDA